MASWRSGGARPAQHVNALELDESATLFYHGASAASTVATVFAGWLAKPRIGTREREMRQRTPQEQERLAVLAVVIVLFAILIGGVILVALTA